MKFSLLKRMLFPLQVLTLLYLNYSDNKIILQVRNRYNIYIFRQRQMRWG